MPANKTIAAVVIQHILSYSALASRTDWRKHTHNIQQQRLLYESSSPSALPAHHSTNILLRSPSSYGCSSFFQQHRAGSNNKNKVRRWFEKHFFTAEQHTIFSVHAVTDTEHDVIYPRDWLISRISQWHKQESKLFRSKNSISTAGGISRKFFLFWHTIASENCHCGEQNERVTKCILILKMHLLKNAQCLRLVRWSWQNVRARVGQRVLQQ